jgi:hypothetical protein
MIMVKNDRKPHDRLNDIVAGVIGEAAGADKAAAPRNSR